jgi:transcriptional regulator with XRE-family HTH domain
MPCQPRHSVPEILQLRAEGKTYAQVARHFGISSSRVGQIIRRERRRASVAERSAARCREIGARNDLARKLPIDGLFCVLGLPPSFAVVSAWERGDLSSIGSLSHNPHAYPPIQTAAGTR